MSWILTDKEIEAVVNLPGQRRYEYWIKKVADHQKIWSLWQEGWALASDDAGQELVPVWPHQKYAELCASGHWTGYISKEIDLDVWIERWLPGLERDGKLVAVFPTSAEKGVVVAASRLESDLREELSLYD